MEQVRAPTNSLPMLPKAIRSWMPSGITTPLVATEGSAVLEGFARVKLPVLTKFNLPPTVVAVPATYNVVPFSKAVRAAETGRLLVIARRATETADTLATAPPHSLPQLRT